MYAQDEREIYGPYQDGENTVYGDPMAIHRELVHHLDGDPNKILSQVKSEGVESEAMRYDATKKLLNAVVVAFGLHPFDKTTGKGLRETDCMKLFTHFTDWLSKKNENTESMPTSVPPTTSPPAPSPTKCIPGFTSISREHASREPARQPLASAS